MERNFFLLSIVLLLSAIRCFPTPSPSPSAAGLQAWIDAPLDGSVLPLNAYQVVAHVASPSGKLNKLEFTVNGVAQEIAPLDTSGESLITVKYRWHPPAPGTYLLGLGAIDQRGASVLAEALVEIEGPVTRTPTPGAPPLATPTRTVPPAQPPTATPRLLPAPLGATVTPTRQEILRATATPSRPPTRTPTRTPTHRVVIPPRLASPTPGVPIPK